MKKYILAILLCLSSFFSTYSFNSRSFYVIEQLDKHVTCLSAVQHGNITLRNVSFKDERIATCAHEIEIGESLKPLKKLWAKAKEEDSTNNAFIGEFCVLLFFSYQEVLRNINPQLSKPVTRISWFAVMALYAQLSVIPLPKLFDALEECWMLYQNISNEYKIEGNDQSFSTWIEEYWWVPSTCIVFVVISFVRWLKERQARLDRQNHLVSN